MPPSSASPQSPSSRANAATDASDGVHSPGDAQHQPADAAIPHQQVGAVADDRHRRARVFRGVERDGDFIRRNDVHQHVGRPADAQRGILRHGGLGHDAIRREIGLNQRLNQGIHQKRKPPEGIDIRIVPYFQKRHKEKQKKTPVSSICRKRADYFCPSGRQLKPRKSEIRKALFRNDSSYAVFADDGERRVFSGKAELFAA